MFKFTNRSTDTHHTIIKWAIGLQFIGILINVIISLWEGTDIGFFSANTLFSSTTTHVIAVGFVAVLFKDTNIFLYFTILSIFNFIYSIQPIVIWTDEGNLCDNLSQAQQQKGTDCYNSAVGADGSNFANLVSIVTQCYQSNGILTTASGVCYNIRWGQTQGNTIRAFELISWLCQFLGTLASIICGVFEISYYGKLRILNEDIDSEVRYAIRQYLDYDAGLRRQKLFENPDEIKNRFETLRKEYLDIIKSRDTTVQPNYYGSD
jgi:hypothetical protein